MSKKPVYVTVQIEESVFEGFKDLSKKLTDLKALNKDFYEKFSIILGSIKGGNELSLSEDDSEILIEGITLSDIVEYHREAGTFDAHYKALKDKDTQ